MREEGRKESVVTAINRHVKKAEPAKKEEEVVDNGKSSAPVDADTAQGAKQ